MARAKKELLTDEEAMLVRFGWRIITSGKRRYMDPKDKKDYPLTMAMIIFSDRQQRLREERDAYWAKVLETLDTDDEATFEWMFPPVSKGASNGQKQQPTVQKEQPAKRKARAAATSHRAKPAAKSDARGGRVRPARWVPEGKSRVARKGPSKGKGKRTRLSQQ